MAATSTLTIRLPGGPLEFEAIELLGDRALLRYPGWSSPADFGVLNQLWSEADEDREQLVLSGPVAFRVPDSAIVSIGDGAILELGYRQERPIANLYDGSWKARATLSDGRWSWDGGFLTSTSIVIARPELLFGVVAVPDIPPPGQRSRPSGLSERLSAPHARPAGAII